MSCAIERFAPGPYQVSSLGCKTHDTLHALMDIFVQFVDFLWLSPLCFTPSSVLEEKHNQQILFTPTCTHQIYSLIIVVHQSYYFMCPLLLAGYSTQCDSRLSHPTCHLKHECLIVDDIMYGEGSSGPISRTFQDAILRNSVLPWTLHETSKASHIIWSGSQGIALVKSIASQNLPAQQIDQSYRSNSHNPHLFEVTTTLFYKAHSAARL